MNEAGRNPTVDLTFPHRWQAEILPARPLILPGRHFVYPAQAEEVERGALEVLIRPASSGQPARQVDVLKGHDFSRADIAPKSERALAPEGSLAAHTAERSPTPEFLATCALGFRDPAVPTGIWSCPNPDEICAVSGGYAYVIDATDPSRFTMVPYRPVLQALSVPAEALLLFVSHHAILAWGVGGKEWQSEKLSDEGVSITSIENGQLHGQGWSMLTDKETPFSLELSTGLKVNPRG
ncbi:MAG: hypothetical protein ABSF53_09075 [Terracidiphilus sp.]|jgi:hypothetical protein